MPAPTDPLPRPAPVSPSPAPSDALPSFMRQQPQRLPVLIDAPGDIEGGWPKPETTGLFVGSCRLGPPPQGWTRADIVSAVMKVSYEDWQGGMPLASSRELGEYRRQGGEGPADRIVWQRDETDCLTGRPHPASLTVGSQRIDGAAPRHASLEVIGTSVDETRPASGSSGSPAEVFQTRKLMRREYHGGNFELCLALNAEALVRLRDSGELDFFTGSDDPSYPLALRRATLSVTYGERRAPEAQPSGDTEILGGLASMAGRWRQPGEDD